MKNEIIIAIIFVLIIGNMPLVFSQEMPSFIKESSKGAEYNSEGIGLSFKYPISWKISTDSSKLHKCDPSCIIVLERTSNNENNYIHLSISAKDTTYFEDKCNCSSLLDYMRYQYNESFKNLNMTSIKDNKTTISNGTNAWQMQYVDNNRKNYVLWFLDKYFYEVNYSVNNDKYVKYLPEVKYIINSIKPLTSNSINITKQEKIIETPSFLNKSINLPSVPSNPVSLPDIHVSIVSGASMLGNQAFDPNPLEVVVGQKVIWKNDDTAFHTVTSGSPGSADSGKVFDSGLAGPNALTTKGKEFEFTFNEPGEFLYYCQLHPMMTGKVIVKSPDNGEIKNTAIQTKEIGSDIKSSEAISSNRVSRVNSAYEKSAIPPTPEQEKLANNKDGEKKDYSDCGYDGKDTDTAGVDARIAQLSNITATNPKDSDNDDLNDELECLQAVRAVEKYALYKFGNTLNEVKEFVDIVKDQNDINQRFDNLNEKLNNND